MDVCTEMNIPRWRYEAWVSGDEVFRKQLKVVETEINDRVRKLAFKQMGLLPMSESDPKNCNISLIKDFLQGEINMSYAEYDEETNVPGVAADVVKNLARPEAQKESVLPGVRVAGPSHKKKVQDPVPGDKVAAAIESPGIPAVPELPAIPVEKKEELVMNASMPETVQ